MNQRMLVSTILLGVVFLGGACAAFPYLDDAGLDIWNVPATQTTIEAGQRDFERKNLETMDVLRRIEAKNLIIDDLVAGRIGLLEAAVRFRDVGYDPKTMSVLPGDSWDERLVRSVLAWVRGRTIEDPDGVRPVLERLEAEFQELLDKHGTIVLPQRTVSDASQ